MIFTNHVLVIQMNLDIHNSNKEESNFFILNLLEIYCKISKENVIKSHKLMLFMKRKLIAR